MINKNRMGAKPPADPQKRRAVESRILQWLIVILSCAAAALIPVIWPDILSLTPVQHITFVIFAMAAALWILEPVPVYATSLLIIGSLAALLSNSAITPLRNYLLECDKDHMLSFKQVLNSFSDPVIILFLGGFGLAIAASKYKLDVNLARVMLKPFGKRPKFVMLGIMAITGGFAMFMSNTATTVMMLAMITPVIMAFNKADPGIKGLILCVPFAANIGGIATPIGTPPNAIALGKMQEMNPETAIDFMHWMMIGLPLALVCIFIVWVLLCLMFRSTEKEVVVKIDSQFSTDWRSMVVYAVFGITILLWMTEKLHGINSYVVALVPLIGYTCTGIIKAEDIKTMNWDVIWLIAGGIAIGNALGQTGLAEKLANIVDYSKHSGIIIVVLIGSIGWALSNFISNTAAANLMIPIAAAVLTQAGDIGIETPMVLMCVALCMSFAMTLPISTPPNALAYATGFITNKDMMKAGGIASVICLGLCFLILWIS